MPLFSTLRKSLTKHTSSSSSSSEYLLPRKDSPRSSTTTAPPPRPKPKTEKTLPALPVPSKSTHRREARLARLTEEARERVKLFADPYLGLPPDFLSAQELRNLKNTLIQLWHQEPVEAFRIGFGLYKLGQHQYYSAILVSARPGKAPYTLACGERVWHGYGMTKMEVEREACWQLVLEIQKLYGRRFGEPPRVKEEMRGTVRDDVRYASRDASGGACEISRVTHWEWHDSGWEWHSGTGCGEKEDGRSKSPWWKEY